MDKSRIQRAYRLGRGELRDPLRCGVIVRDAEREAEFVTSQYALVYVHSGKGVYHTEDGRDFPFAAGDVFQRFPDVLHTVSYTAGVTAFIAVPAQVYEMFVFTGGLCCREPVFHVGASEAILADFRQMCGRLGSSLASGLMECLLEMQGLILKLHQKGLDRSEAEAGSEDLMLAVRILEKDLGERISMPEVAEVVHMSYSSFRKKFRDEFGVSPGIYRVRRRIERSAVLLQDSSRSVGDVASELGYPDVYSFSAQFRKIIGLSPGKFRRQE